jgi:ABC-type protease/lipase transport system fused ATPase/permease subunit
LRDILKATALPQSPAVALPRPCRRLLVQNLTVRAPGTERVIVANVSFSLEAGTGLALLGASASGKSSLVKALVGVWPASNGVVRLDDAALDQWRLDDLGRHFGYLPQDVALFDGSVAENIARFDETAASEDILEAARVAGAHELILRLPNGYSTRIGEGGTLLSAGQRQRIGLARAIFGNPFLIVLDEPNANLDADGENALSKAIETLRRGKRIVIVVSHRPSAVAALNMAMVLNQGSVIAFGPREEAFAQVTRAAVGQAPFGLVKPGPALVAGGARP